jgi:hypothetical protein
MSFKCGYMTQRSAFSLTLDKRAQTYPRNMDLAAQKRGSWAALKGWPTPAFEKFWPVARLPRPKDPRQFYVR